jgi:hypothetical protein
VRDYGPTDAPEDRNTDAEFKRRLRNNAVAAISNKPTGASPAAASPGSPATPAGLKGDKGDAGATGPAGPPGPVIDRLHKESGSIYGGYVFVGQDHDASEFADQTPPTNPGWRTITATASSLNDAYAKAIVITQIAGFQYNSRVAIIVLGGNWYESLICTSPQIDLIGIGRPLVDKIYITATATTFRMENFEVYYPVLPAGSDSAVFIEAAPVLTLPYSSVQFKNVWVHGNQRAFVTYRRVYCEDCWIWCDAIVDQSLEDPPLQIYASTDDIDWSVFKGCNIWGYTDMELTDDGIVSGRNSWGFAIKASSNVGEYINFGSVIAGLTQQGGTYFTLPNSGVKFEDCKIHGLLLCDVWTVKQDGCECISAMPNVARAQLPYGGAYAVIRGIGLTLAEDPPLTVQIPGRVFWDHSTVNSSFIAVFVNETTGFAPGFGSTARPWGGAAHFRHSEHLCQYGPVGADAFAYFSAPGQVFHDMFSSTPSTNWADGVNIVAAPDNVTGAGQLLAAVYDPYLL